MLATLWFTIFPCASLARYSRSFRVSSLEKRNFCWALRLFFVRYLELGTCLNVQCSSFGRKESLGGLLKSWEFSETIQNRPQSSILTGTDARRVLLLSTAKHTIQWIRKIKSLFLKKGRALYECWLKWERERERERESSSTNVPSSRTVLQREFCKNKPKKCLDRVCLAGERSLDF